jgi:hypothetical protein
MINLQRHHRMNFSLFYLQSITIIPIIITTAIAAAHMTQTAAPSGMCKNFATIIVNRLTIRPDSRRVFMGFEGLGDLMRSRCLSQETQKPRWLSLEAGPRIAAKISLI